MTAIRLSLARPGATAKELLTIGRWAAACNLGLWLGDPFAPSSDDDRPNSDDSYVTAAAGALAMATEHVRMGIFLTLRGSASPVRLAEDIAVLDQMSGGRLDVGLVAPGRSMQHGDDPAWRDTAEKLLDAWHGWPLPDGRAPAMTPPPAQPFLPAVIVGDPDLAERLGCGIAGAFLPPKRAAPRRRRIAIHAAGIGANSVEGWLSADPRERIGTLREAAERVQAHELILALDQPNVTEADVTMLSRVVATGLKASAGDRASLIDDAWIWATQRRLWHTAPESD